MMNSLDDPAVWAGLADTVDEMIAAIHADQPITKDLTVQLIRTQNPDLDLGTRLVMMALVAATTLQRLAAHVPGPIGE
jgi:hypothetical protein